jgi:hypothetical protein
MSHFCPTCNRILYNRRLVNCGFCNAAIPEALRFTAEEITVLDRRTAEIEQASRERAQAREDEEELQRKKNEAIAAVIPFFFIS